MTCKICFGDQTMWRRDANGKAIEVPCSCVGVGVASPAIDVRVRAEAEEYNALPHCPVAYPYPSPIHASKRAPTEDDAGSYGRVLIWDKPHQCWYPIYWTGIPLGVDVWWMPWPNLPPPPEQP